MGEVAPFEIVMDGLGHGTVLIGTGTDQIDVSELITALQLNAKAHEPTTLILKQKPGPATIKGEGIIYVQQEKIDALTVLEMLNGDELEALALEKMEWGDGRKLAGVILELIKEAIVAARS